MSNEYIFELLKNNSSAIDALNETLWDIKETTFKILYDAQKSIADIDKIDIDMNDYIDNKTKYIYSIKHEYIREHQRLLYRKSNFYKKELSLSTLYKNPQIFTDIPLLFINGELYTNYTITISDGYFNIIFKIDNEKLSNIRDIKTCFSREEFETLLYGKSAEKYNKNKKYNVGDLIRVPEDNGTTTIKVSTNNGTVGDYDSYAWEEATSSSKMSVVFISNCATSFENKIFNVTNVQEKFTNYAGLPLKEYFTLYANKIAKTDNIMSFMTCTDHLYKYHILDSVKGWNTANKIDTVTLKEEQLKSFNDTVRATRIFHILNMRRRLFVDANTDYFQLDIENMPIPVENMIIFKRVHQDKDRWDMFYDHDTTIELFYPNVYKIHRPENQKFDVIIYIFYSDDTKSVGSKYTNELQLYHRFTKNLLDKYKDGSIPEFIETYKPIYEKYDIKDYTSSEYRSDNNHLDYKINKFKKLISQNGEFYRWYLKRIVGYIPKFDIRMSEISSTLGSRYKTHNRLEIKDPSLHKVFTEPRYLFIFRYDDGESYLFTIDNYAYFPDQIYHDNKYVYVYIPQKLLKLDEKYNIDSVIHVEKVTDVDFRKRIEYTDSSEEYIHIEVNTSPKIFVNDLFLTHSIDGEEFYLDNTKYEIYVVNETNGSMMLSDNTSFYKYSDIYIKILDESLKHEELYVVANRINFNQRLIGENVFTINTVINNDPLNIAVFKNGRRLPDDMLKINFSENISGPHTIKALTTINDTDEFVFSYTQNKHIEVASIEEIDESGYVDLTDAIREPIDLDWHEIYVNGLKLNDYNIDVLTPYSFILTGINTLKNLVVYRRNFDQSGIIISPSDDISDDVTEQIIDNVPGFIDEMLDGLPVITDELPNIMDEFAVDLIGFLDEYLFTFGLLNPDIEQITEEMITDYADVLNDNNSIFINPDESNHGARNVYLNPDDEYYLSL